MRYIGYDDSVCTCILIISNDEGQTENNCKTTWYSATNSLDDFLTRHEKRSEVFTLVAVL